MQQDDENLESAQDENKNKGQDDSQKIDITEITKYKTTVSQVWKPFDFLFPAGKLAKLVRIYDYYAKIPYNDILTKLKLSEGFPVVNLIGAKDTGRGKFYAGIARAAFNTDAIILDSGIATGIEQYAIRRGVKLIGIAPENEIKFPKLNPTKSEPNELSNGHTHLFLLNSPKEELAWTQEAIFKMELGLKIAEGVQVKDKKRFKCKIVNVLMADSPYFEDEVRLAVKYGQPIIIVQGSKMCKAIIHYLKLKDPKNQEDQKQQDQDNQDDGNDGDQKKDQKKKEEIDTNIISEELKKILDSNYKVEEPWNNKLFILESDDSEDIAQYIHFLLTVTPWDTEEDKAARERAKGASQDNHNNKGPSQNNSNKSPSKKQQ